MSIAAGQIVGYIESMRLMNEVVSSVAGTVEAAVTTEGQPVEYGQALFSVIGR
jgi:acetyl-CoA carboxylase biotin carboxyl carrier protein